MWMWFPEGQEGIVAQLRRATVLETDDSGTQQMLKRMTGLKSETFEDVYRAQPHGFSSHPPEGSEGKFLALGGRSDRLVALGFEHKKHRPKDTPEGGTVLYNHTGDIIRVFEDNLDAVHAKKINIKIGKGQESSDEGSSAADGEGEENISIVLNTDDVTITKGESRIVLTAEDILVEGASDIAVGVPGRYVRVRPGRVDLGVTDPKGEATPQVETTAGPSSIVFAVV
jgi:phage baseplate assembly protein V